MNQRITITQGPGIFSAHGRREALFFRAALYRLGHQAKRSPHNRGDHRGITVLSPQHGANEAGEYSEAPNDL